MNINKRVKMLTCNLMGGLGNQLFQIFTTIACALQTGQLFVFTNRPQLVGGRFTYWRTFLTTLEPHTTDQIRPDIHVREAGFHFTPLPITALTATKHKTAMLNGYFQSHKYFEKEYIDICQLIGLNKWKQTIPQKLKVPYDQTISMHFRIGDYLHLQDCHPVQPLQYYRQALTHIVQEIETIQTRSADAEINPITTILYFCEDADLLQVSQHVAALSSQFPQFQFIRANPGLADWEQLVCMSACRHNIIANSTFSWWGAYFNDRPDKIVCFPNHWFGPSYSHNTADLCPEDWVRIY